MSLRVAAHGNRLAAVGQRIVVEVDEDAATLTLRAPFYRRTIPLDQVVSAQAQPDGGTNRGVVNWFVVGRADSPQGVRLSTGGRARVDVTTTDGRRYGIVLDAMDQAQQVVRALAPGQE